jgi:signal transduction histidine kinase
MRECGFHVTRVDPSLTVMGDRGLLLAALANLVNNAFKFTLAHTHVALTAYAAGDHILIEVKDHCGGLRGGISLPRPGHRRPGGTSMK